MGTEAQQALQRRRPAIQRGGGARNQEGTRRAQQKALQRTGTKARTQRARGPSKRDVRDAKWDQAADQQRAEFKERYSGYRDGAASYGGMGYGPTSPAANADPAMKKANARANPDQMIRQALNKAADPTVVRAEGSIWDDPQYAALANEHGANYAMKARNFDRQLQMGRQTQGVLNQSMADQFGREQMKRDNARDQMAFQQEAAAYGTPGQVSQAYAGGQRAPDGSIVRPGAQRTDPRTGLAVDESGAFTGQGMQDQTVASAPQPPQQPTPTPQDQAKLIESYAKILEDRRMPEDMKSLVREELRKTLSGGQTNTSQSPWPEYPDAFEENGQWFVERGGKRFRLEFEE